MKISMIPPPSLSSSTMKPPFVCSVPVPSLMDINPFTPPEFHFPSQDMEWDFSDLSSSEPEEDYHDDSDINVSFSSSFYQISPGPDFTDDEDEEHDMKDEEDDVKNKEDVMNDEDDVKEGDVKEDEVNDEDDAKNDMKDEDVEDEANGLVNKLISTISKIAPKFIYNRRKHSMKRRKNRRKRKRISAASIEPELRSLWHNSVGDLFAPSADSKPSPTLNLPTVNLNSINKTMLRKLPDVIYSPIFGCSKDPSFYERNIPYGVHDTKISAFSKEKPFGKLPAIMTNLGPVPPPTDACYGYVWTEDGWRVKAEYSRVPDPGGGHGRGGGEDDGGGRVGAGRRGWRQRKLCER